MSEKRNSNLPEEKSLELDASDQFDSAFPDYFGGEEEEEPCCENPDCHGHPNYLCMPIPKPDRRFGRRSCPKCGNTGLPAIPEGSLAPTVHCKQCGCSVGMSSFAFTTSLVYDPEWDKSR